MEPRPRTVYSRGALVSLGLDPRVLNDSPDRPGSAAPRPHREAHTSSATTRGQGLEAAGGSPHREADEEIYRQLAAASGQGLIAPQRGEERTSRTAALVTRRFFELCENPRTRERMVTLVRSSADTAVSGPLAMAQHRAFQRLLLAPLVRGIGRSKRVDDAALRWELALAQLGGIAVVRYISKVEPLASMDLETLVARVTPSIAATIRP